MIYNGKSWKVFITFLWLKETSIVRSVFQVWRQKASLSYLRWLSFIIILIWNLRHYGYTLLHFLFSLLIFLEGFLSLIPNQDFVLWTERWHFLKRWSDVLRLKTDHRNPIMGNTWKFIALYNFLQTLNFISQSLVISFQLLILWQALPQ